MFKANIWLICLFNRAGKRRPEEKEPERIKPQVSDEKDEDEKVRPDFSVLLFHISHWLGYVKVILKKFF